MASTDIETTLAEGSIAEIGRAIRSGAVSVEEVVGYFLGRIDALNDKGPSLNAVRTVSPCAIDDARAADAELAAGEDRGPLHGIPVLLKDNILTGCGMPASGGARALADFVPARDATLVECLRRAGAIVLSKTNLTEFADYVSDIMPSEFSGVGGVVKNPHGQAYGRGQGSSVGSAAAIAAGLAPFAIGSETQNSIQTPACHSSVVGYKPSVGIVSRSGVIPLVPSQDSPGPLARSVADAVLALEALKGADCNDTASLAAGLIETAPRRRRGLDGIRLGVPRRAVAEKPEAEPYLAAFESALSRLSAAGATIVDPCDMPSAEQMIDVRSCVFPTEFKASLEAFLTQNDAPCGIGSLEALIAWNEANPDAIPYGQSLLLAANGTAGLDDPQYGADRRRDIALSRQGGIDATIEMAHVDALLAPMSAAARCTGKAGGPVMAIPIGNDGDGRPAGLTIFAERGADARLVAVGMEIERVVGNRLIPSL